jgi:D-alanyl-lipoteichoic acid acyltransferase DltB (MBOAT superfamily)
MFYELSFLLPFFLIYVLYIKLGKEKQNLLIILSSYYFYGLWDWRFLSLLIIQTLSDYMCAIFIDNTSDKKKQKFIMFFSIIFNLTMLGFFKYFNFFVDSFYTLFPNITPSSKIILNIILPPAISFYTFESMSYVIDVYRGTVKAERNFVSFGAFISFFPKLVAGPIERAHTLLDQINKDRTFSVDNFFSGLRLFA